MVNIDDMQFGFVPGRRSTLRQTNHFILPLSTWKRLSTELQEKYYGGL